ncbi:hypothetical protein NEDG_00539 [Nematocida displodere]|uniref:t-SNARE coiled-coil homology domain-containing protein n=1 Tax=Nematocida displodere TaxID=1805483 RepID=A0A177ECE6_9MICR|nr:hypothetical protein NEDG_00539 [Nematocida displodere]
MSGLLEFLNRAKETNDTISGLSESVRVADTLKNRTTTVSLESGDETLTAMHKLHQEFKARVGAIKEEISQMKNENEEYLQVHGFDRNFSTRSKHLHSLARRLTLVIEDFRRVQNGFAKHEGERLKNQYLIAKPHASSDELFALEEQDKIRPMLQSIFTLGNKSAREVIMDAEKRRTSIESILQGVADLKDLSNDFVEFISTNGTDMDRVHIDVRSSAGQAYSAEEVIKEVATKAIRTQKAKKNSVIVLALLIILFIFFIGTRVIRM